MKAIVLVASLSVLSLAPLAQAASWNAAAAGTYLDARQTWWQGWSKSQRDHDTACVSCHTVLSYALGRPALRAHLNDDQESAPEQKMLGFIEKRVSLWNEVAPFYNEKSGPTKSVESRGTEAILNAFILASYDARAGHLRDITRTALQNAWALQLDSGTWNWLNFHNAPWEADNSQFWGTTLMAMAVAMAPDGYSHTPQIQSGIVKMRAWLNSGYKSQPLFDQAFLLWASARMPGLLTRGERKALSHDIASLQQPDGGWSLTAFGMWQRKDKTAEETRSDGYATALAVLALNASGTRAGSHALERARAWLIANQQPDGSWSAWSLNKERDPASEVGRFMRDAATGYAALALQSVSGE
jgi:squalene-hopene/tetraprenyl-beta-curcumene cyclase